MSAPGILLHLQKISFYILYLFYEMQNFYSDKENI